MVGQRAFWALGAFLQVHHSASQGSLNFFFGLRHPRQFVRMSSSDIILSYNDAILRTRDLDILRGPHFINDRIIEFYFSYLSTFHSLGDDVLLVPPSISFWTTHCSDTKTLHDVLDPLHLPRKRLVIFTVNDNEDVCLQDGGTHWSLLVYDRKMNRSVHHDSLSRMKVNRPHAVRLLKAIQGEFLKTAGDVMFVEERTPEQRNGYDCGLYVMAIAKIICDWWCGQIGSSDDSKQERWVSNVMETVTSTSVDDFRTEILHLIKSLMEEKQRQRR
ncbi:Sentrin-specific protease [Zostera marina]|uniref:Sentrin-specific protease n=1 Tax=Zostera marina TaxID=29655 RepID=A0A0K9P166_ZOSMR|nr:Sentrin-specific protease [Zostera marina]